MSVQMCPTCGKMLLVLSSNGMMFPIDTTLYCQCQNSSTLTFTTTCATGTIWINPTINNGFAFLPPPGPEPETVPQAFYDAFSDEQVQP